MSAPVLARHGENVKPAYAVSGLTGGSLAGQSTDSARADGNVSGIVKRYRKSESAAPKPISLQLIKRTFGQAIEYSGIPASSRGLMIFFGILALALGAGGGYKILLVASRAGFARPIHILDIVAASFWVFRSIVTGDSGLS